MASIDIEPLPELVEEQIDLPLEKPPQEEVKSDDAWWKDTKIWINLVGYIAVTVALIIIKVRPDFMPSNDRGFPCSDARLSYKSTGSSVQQRTLIISTVSILLMSIFISEGLYSITPEYHSQRSIEAMGEVSLKDKIFLFMSLVISKLLYAYLGLILTMDLTYLMQHLIAGHRPNFIQVCQPNCKEKVVKMTDCRNLNHEMVNEARMSFPSEYASISFFMTVFSSMIIERAFSADFFALKVAVQSSYLFWAIYVSTSRVNDNLNHPMDTFAGSTLGIVIAFLTDYLATYQDYQEIMNYDPSNITLNIQDWEEPEQQPMEEHSEQQQQLQLQY